MRTGFCTLSVPSNSPALAVQHCFLKAQVQTLARRKALWKWAIYLILGASFFACANLTCYFSGNDMVFTRGRAIKSVLATSNTGLSLIFTLRELVGLTLEDFLDFYFTMFTDANTSVDVPVGRVQNRRTRRHNPPLRSDLS